MVAVAGLTHVKSGFSSTMTCYRQLPGCRQFSSQRAHRREVIDMTPDNNRRWFYRTIDLEEAIIACLQLIVTDLRAQYRHASAEAERLLDAGVAAAVIAKRLQDSRKEVKSRYVTTDPDRGLRPAGVRAATQRDLSSVHPTPPPATPVAGKAAHP
jgi:hypothetical protein